MVRVSALVSVLGMICIFAFVGGATAAPIPLSDTSLQDYFDSQGWAIDALNDQVNMPAGWAIAQTSAQASMTFWREDFGGGDISFGIYSLAGLERAEVFDPIDTPVAAAVVYFMNGPGNQAIVIQTQDGGGSTIDIDTFAFTGETFGFYIESGSEVLYSDADLNAGGEDALLLYTPSAGQYLFAGDIDGDGDFSDIVAQAESIQPVPEPGTVFLLGAGLLAVAIVGRKKWAASM